MPTRSGTWSRAHAADELGDALDELVTSVALELFPRAQAARVTYSIDEQLPVEVIALVLERAGGEAPLHVVVRDAVAIEIADADVDVAVDVASQVGHRQAAFVDLDHFVVEQFEH